MLITLVTTANLQIIPRNEVCSQHHNCICSSKLNVHRTFPWPWGSPQPPYNSLGLHNEVVSDKQPIGNHPQPMLNLDLSKRVQVGPGQTGDKDCAQQDG